MRNLTGDSGIGDDATVGLSEGVGDAEVGDTEGVGEEVASDLDFDCSVSVLESESDPTTNKKKTATKIIAR